MLDAANALIQVLGKTYRNGDEVEVLLKSGQKNWTPAVVRSVGVNLHTFGQESGVSAHPTVGVELVNARPSSRLRFRRISLKNIRPAGGEQ